VQPIFRDSCSPCHIGRATSGVELTDHRAVLASVGEQFGKPIVSPYGYAESPLWRKIARLSPPHGLRCPRERPALSRAEIDLIARWIDDGALPAVVSPARGDVDRDGDLDVTDPILILQYLFLGGARPYCLSVADADASGPVDVTDAVYLLLHLFAGGPAPPEMTAEEKTACASASFSRFEPACLSCHGTPLKENSHPGAGTLTRADILRILKAPIVK